VAAISGASNRLIGAEQLSEEELARLAAAYQRLVARTAAEGAGRGSRSVEEDTLANAEFPARSRRGPETPPGAPR
jgi:hypothetical protein